MIERNAGLPPDRRIDLRIGWTAPRSCSQGAWDSSRAFAAA